MTKVCPAEILIATNNSGKVGELRQLLAGLPVRLRYLPDFPGVPEVDETGTTYAENAVLKACEYARRSGLWAIADDSGLEIDALGGEPGVHSARYGGDIPFDEKIDLLLARIPQNAPRTARFVCVTALADSTGRVLLTAEGVCSGTISETARGSAGFGYDPIFMPSGFEQTFAELTTEVKQQISHRSRAAAVLIRYLLHFIEI